MGGWLKLSLATATALLAMGPGASAAPRARPPASAARNLEGVWSADSYTQFERPVGFAGLVADPAEARAFETRLDTTKGVLIPPGFDTVGQVDSEFKAPSGHLARVRGQVRSSWITAPANGRLPYSAAGKARSEDRGGLDNPENVSPAERCLSSYGSSAPLLPSRDMAVVQIVQSPGSVAILAETNNDARLIAMNGAHHPLQPPSWSGDAVGRWDGDTLVVDTVGFRSPWVSRDFLVHSADAHVVERFTRVAADELLYRFTLTDPKAFTAPVEGEMSLRRIGGRLFESACHEGNYALTNMLAGARKAEQKPSSSVPSGSTP